MFQFLKSLREKWSNWSGDRDLEVAIRRHLTNNGLYGGTAQLQNVRLAAVQRPGWLQVYRFDAWARVMPSTGHDEGPDLPAEYKQLYGLVREDIRYDQTAVRTFETPDARRQLFNEWSVDLIQLRGGRAMS